VGCSDAPERMSSSGIRAGRGTKVRGNPPEMAGQIESSSGISEEHGRE